MLGTQNRGNRMTSFQISFIIVVFSSILSAANFYELRGFEDENNHTQLYYRIHTESDDDIYHMDVFSNSDSVFLDEYYSPPWFPGGWPSYNFVYDYEIWNNNPTDFISCGFENDQSLGKWYLISSRFEYHWGPALYNLELSKQNDSLVYAVDEWDGLYISLNSGYDWQSLNQGYSQLWGVSPFDDQVLFASDEAFLYKSINGGLNFNLVDSSGSIGEVFFDCDSSRLYLLSNNQILISENSGESWELLYEDSVRLFVSLDKSTSGMIYLASENQILISQDFGYSFDPYLSMESEITGIYKKPESEILFVSTIDHIYQINNMEITTLKMITGIPGGELPANIPITDHLYQNYPNPFNSTTIIEYQISHAKHVEIKIYGIDGQLVDTLVDREQAIGNYSVKWEANNIASGMYFYILILDGQIRDTQRLLLIK